jgi:L-rhamnose mutarotase
MSADLENKVIRKTFVMQMKEGKVEEYRASHNEGFWPEMRDMLLAHGCRHYVISLLPGTHQLFGYLEITDEALWAKVPETDVCKRWWAWMEEFIVFGEDKRPVSSDLTEMFCLSASK